MKDGLLVGDDLIDLPDGTADPRSLKCCLGKFPFVTEHVLVITDPYLVEFLCIVGVDGQEFNPFIKGQGFVHGLLQHPEIER